MPFDVFRAGSPFSGKFVLFKPVLFVQVMPAGSKDAGNGRTAGRFRLTSRLEEEITGSMPGAGTSRGSHHSTKSRGMLSIASPSDFPASPSLRSSKHFSRRRLSDCLFTRGWRIGSPALRSALELRKISSWTHSSRRLTRMRGLWRKSPRRSG